MRIIGAVPKQADQEHTGIGGASVVRPTRDPLLADVLADLLQFKSDCRNSIAPTACLSENSRGRSTPATVKPALSEPAAYHFQLFFIGTIPETACLRAGLSYQG